MGYGTHGVEEGTTMTVAEATKAACRDIRAASDVVQRTVPVPLTHLESIAYISLIYNIGEGGWLRSRVLRAARLGDRHGAIRALGTWTRSGGERNPELVRRRGIETRFATGCYVSIGSCRVVSKLIAGL